MRVQRFDRLEVKLDRDTVKVQTDGSRIVDGVGAHVGPYVYHDENGAEFIELVPASTLFDAASLASAEGTAVTIRHGPGLVTPDSYRAEAHGAWVKAWDAGDGNMGVRLRLGSREILEFVDRRLDAGESIELSPVYTVDVADEPGTTEAGPHHAVQRDREYSGIAALGQGEARGGPTSKLHADGPECAPAGSRVQVRRPRLDSGPRAVQHSETGRSKMKQATITVKGKPPRKVSSDMATLLGGMRFTAEVLDAIETTTVTLQKEGEEPDVLTLPDAMVASLFEGLGITTAAEPPAETVVEEEVALEARDAEDEDKLDSKTVKLMISDALDIRDRKVALDSARTTSVNSDAATILPPGYDYSVHWTHVALDAIAKGHPDDVPAAQKLIAKVMNGDSVAEGMLRQMLADRRQKTAASVRLAPAKTNTDASEPWNSPTMPASEAKQ